MRRTLSAFVVAAAVAGFTAPAFAMGGCGGTHTADGKTRTYETASADQSTTTKPIQQTQVPQAPASN